MFYCWSRTAAIKYFIAITACFTFIAVIISLFAAFKQQPWLGLVLLFNQNLISGCPDWTICVLLVSLFANSTFRLTSVYFLSFATALLLVLLYLYAALFAPTSALLYGGSADFSTADLAAVTASGFSCIHNCAVSSFLLSSVAWFLSFPFTNSFCLALSSLLRVLLQNTNDDKAAIAWVNFLNCGFSGACLGLIAIVSCCCFVANASSLSMAWQCYSPSDFDPSLSVLMFAVLLLLSFI